MKYKKYDDMADLAEDIGLPRSYAAISKLKTQMTIEILKLIKEKNITHQEIADRSGIPRSAVTGILSGSLQKVTVDRLLRIAEALGKKVQFTWEDAA